MEGKHILSRALLCHCKLLGYLLHMFICVCVNLFRVWCTTEPIYDGFSVWYATTDASDTESVYSKS